MSDIKFIRLKDNLIEKRKAQINASGFCHVTHSNHMCAILRDGIPISYGTNSYSVNSKDTEHAEAQALRKLSERIGRPSSSKKITIDLIIVRTNGGNSRPCDRCINMMQNYLNRFSIRYIYYTFPDEPSGIRCVKFSKLIKEDRHYCSFDRNIRRRCRWDN
jgi:tRNA(Arg) A34 adenosine deaminase TadA